MIVQEKTKDVEITGALDSTIASVSSSGMRQVSKLLRDNLYVDKLSASMREVLANAIDESLESGAVQKVKVHVPTEEESYYSVRDFGRGLSHENVFKVFFQYFESTKQNDRLSIGGWGIGAKSPFAAVSEMVVTSWHGGVRNVYLAVNNGQDIIANLASSTKSNEPSGIEVRFETPNWSSFQTKFKTLYKNFREYYEVDLNIEITEAREKPMKEVKIKYLNSSSSVWHKGIVYKTEFTWGPCNCLMYVPDEVTIDIHPSRERLEETDRNKNVLGALAEKYVSEKAANIRDNAPKDKFELWRFLAEKRNEVRFLRYWECAKDIEAVNPSFTVHLNKYNNRVLYADFSIKKTSRYESNNAIELGAETKILWFPCGTKLSVGMKLAIAKAYDKFSYIIIGGESYDKFATFFFDPLSQSIPLRNLLINCSGLEPIKTPRAKRTYTAKGTVAGKLTVNYFKDGSWYNDKEIDLSDTELGGKKIYSYPSNNNEVDGKRLPTNIQQRFAEKAIRHLTSIKEIVVVGIRRKDIKKNPWPCISSLIIEHANSAEVIKNWSHAKAKEADYLIGKVLGVKKPNFHKMGLGFPWPVEPTNPVLVKEVEEYNQIVEKHEKLLAQDKEYAVYMNALNSSSHNYSPCYTLDHKFVIEKLKSYYD